MSDIDLLRVAEGLERQVRAIRIVASGALRPASRERLKDLIILLEAEVRKLELLAQPPCDVEAAQGIAHGIAVVADRSTGASEVPIPPGKANKRPGAATGIASTPAANRH